MNFILKCCILLTAISASIATNQKASDYSRPICMTDTAYKPVNASADLTSILNFELNLYHLLSPKSGQDNFIFSPYSIWNALVIAYLGSAGRTENQLKYALGLPDKDSTWKQLRTLELDYKIRSIIEKGNILKVTNRVYFDQTVDLRHCMEGVLHSELFVMDFTQPIKCAEIINSDISEATAGKITGIVNPRDVDRILMAIVNAAYFKGAWEYPFDPLDTAVSQFTTMNGDIINVDMMLQQGEFDVGHDELLGAEILEFPYVGDTISMFFFKPLEESKDAFDRMSNNLTPESLLRAMSSTRPRNTRFSLPRFNLETLITEELKQALLSLGVSDAFHATNADFRDFTNQHVSLDNGVHKATIEVTEEGTVAAGTTIFISTKIGGIKLFELNRPFVFAVIDKKTSNVVFIGSLVNPTPTKITGHFRMLPQVKNGYTDQDNVIQPEQQVSDQDQSVPIQQISQDSGIYQTNSAPTGLNKQDSGIYQEPNTVHIQMQQETPNTEPIQQVLPVIPSNIQREAKVVPIYQHITERKETIAQVLPPNFPALDPYSENKFIEQESQ